MTTRTSRALSSSSPWHLDPDAPDYPRDQRRIRHLSSLQIRNLTLNPRRDQLSSLLTSNAPTPTSSTAANAAATTGGARGSRLSFASDDTDLYLRTRRRRAASNASQLAGSPAHHGGGARAFPFPSDGRDEGAAATAVGHGSAAVSGSMRRSSSSGAGTPLRAPVGIEEESEGATSPSAAEPDEYDDADDDLSLAHSPETSSSFGASHSGVIFPSMRRRSTSRASLASAETGGSGSTVRVAPPRAQELVRAPALPLSTLVAPTEDPNKGGRVSYTSEAQLAKEKQRRAETLRRRLVDSFISLSLVPRSSETDAVTGRRRGGSGSASSRAKLVRTNSSTTPTRGRNRTISTPAAPQPPSSTSHPPPFFISSPQYKTTHPTFPIDHGDFLVERPERWTGLADNRVLVGVWTRTAEASEESEKGKEKAADSEWRLLVEWDVDLDGLISLGRDPTTFPPLPPNSLVFTLHDEYFTAPLPSSRRAYGSDSGSSASDDGNQSDPGTLALVARRRKRDEEQDHRRKQQVLVEKSVRETRMVQPASSEALLRLLRVQQSMDETQAELVDLTCKVDGALADGVLSAQREIVERGSSVNDLETAKSSLTSELLNVGNMLKTRREALRARRGRLKAASELNDLNRSLLAENRVSLAEDESICRSVQQQAHSRRTQLITLLSHIFPIDPAPDDGATTSLLFTILALPLPNSSFPPSSSDDMISSALGYTAQVVSMLSLYLGVPLHYPIQCLGSRSAVVDLISVMRGPRAFPLYGKGVDRYRFDYGVFLLNKNIEQLMYSQGLIVIDLRNTLPNLKSLILGLSYDPSHADFSSATLATPPQFDPAPASEPIPALTDDILDDFTSPARPHPSGSTASSSATESDEEDDEDEVTRSPSTLKALSVRSMSPVPTLNGKMNGNGNGNGSEAGVCATEKAISVASLKGKNGTAKGAWSLG